MEIWQYLEILKEPKKGWFFSDTDIDRKLIALGNIATEGKLSDIYPLIPYLKHPHKAIREGACNAIIYLFKKAATKNAYYNAFKYCDITTDDIDYYRDAFAGEAYLQLLAICSFNGNGYVREKAVRLLAATNNSLVIPFLIYRLADWVPAVTMAAMQNVLHFKQPAFVDALVEHLPIFEWLQRVERTSLHEIYQVIIDYLILDNRELILKNFSNYPDRIRTLLATHISKSFSDDPKEIATFLSDKHFLVRMQALEHFEKLYPAAIEQLLNDESAKVRLQTLRHLKNHDNFNEILHRFLTDSSGNIRQFARYWLRDAVTDFSVIYHEHILNGRHINICITGLAELNDKRYISLIADFLQANEIKIRKTAFLALTKLDIEAAYRFALDNMDSELRGLRKLIMRFLPHISRREVFEKARTCFQHGNDEIRMSMLSLFSSIGGWSVAADLLLGLIDNNDHIRQLSYDAIQRWRSRAVCFFMRPEQADIDRANLVLRLVAERSKERGYSYGRTLEEVAFLLK